MKERPILFSGPMVRAILAGTKTQTRRIVKPQPRGHIAWKNGSQWIVSGYGEVGDTGLYCPHGESGDRLWVRETWQSLGIHEGLKPSEIPPGSDVQYPATYDGWVSKHRPSIHMPRWASRITLEVTGVSVERLNDISDTDAQAEGVEGHYIEDGWYWRNHLLSDEDAAVSPMLESATDSFRTLWESINGDDSWAANPWVWVVEFRRIDQ